MANAIVYVNSAAAGLNDGTSWVNAYTTLIAAIAANGTTGTDFYVKSTHVEGGAGATTFNFKGAAVTPDRVFSCGSTNSPPTTGDLTFGANLNTTVGALNINGYVYIYGCSIQAASGTTVTFYSATPGEITLDTCKIIHTGAAATTPTIGPNTGSNNGARVTWINTTLKYGAVGAGMQVRSGIFRWLNTTSAIDGTGSLPTALFFSASTSGTVLVLCDGVDFSALTNKAMTSALANNGAYQFTNCKLPTGLTVGVPTQPAGVIIDFINCDSGSTNYKQSRYNCQGTLTQSTSAYNNATDGTTPISWQAITTANANPQSPFECFDIIQWAAAGTYAASKIFATSATGALKTNDIWVDVQYLGASYPLGAPATTLGAGSGTALLPQIPQGTTPGSITTGAAWGTGGLGTNYSLDIPSFTTSAAGYVRFRVKVAKASLTINIDPAATVA